MKLGKNSPHHLSFIVKWQGRRLAANSDSHQPKTSTIFLQKSNPVVTAPFNNMRTLTFKAQPTNAFFATINQVFGDYCQACSNQIVEHSSDNETVLGTSRKLGGAAEHLIDGSEKPICRLSFEF